MKVRDALKPFCKDEKNQKTTRAVYGGSRHKRTVLWLAEAA